MITGCCACFASSAAFRSNAFIWSLQWMLLHGDLPGHPRVDRTEVRVSYCGDEGVGEALPGIQYGRLLELCVSARHDVRHAVVVGPGHGCAGRHRECFRKAQ